MKIGLRLLIVAVLACVPLQAQQFDDFGRGRAREMLRNIAEDVKKYYYDPTFHGVNFDALVHDADEKLRHATSVTESFKLIAGALMGLNDSHTYFDPPLTGFKVDYGWQMQMIGTHCYITHVRPGSDAETKGLKPGDEVISVNGMAANRSSFETIRYVIYTLSRQPELRLQVRSPGAQERQLVVAAKVEPIRLRGDLRAEGITLDVKFRKMQEKTFPRCESLDPSLGVCKIGAFAFEDKQTHELLNFARKHQALILDLRGNPGGTLTALQGLLGCFFDHDVMIGKWVTRKDVKSQVAKPQQGNFPGKLVVLVDSLSASSAEIFTRILQLERRGTVIGDRSSGSVREAGSYHYELKLEQPPQWYYAMITKTDIVLANGESLEHKGITPDEGLLPTQADLASGNDPVLARAAEVLGAKLPPDKAGKLFPFEWPEM
jgi:C-terminal processing protease CtpA/Prc